jgi:hypothetical protein
MSIKHLIEFWDANTICFIFIHPVTIFIVTNIFLLLYICIGKYKNTSFFMLNRLSTPIIAYSIGYIAKI